MIILAPDHIITGEEYVRDLTAAGDIDCFASCNSHDMRVHWTPFKWVFGPCWRGKRLKDLVATSRFHYEFCQIDANEYFPNVAKRPRENDLCVDMWVNND